MGNLLHLTEHLRRRSLVIPDLLHQTRLPNSFKNANGTQARNVSRVLGNVKGNSNVTLRTQVVNLIRLQLIEQLHQLYGIRQVAVMKKQIRVIHQGILVEMIQATGIEGGCAPHDAMYLVSLLQEKLCKIRTILTCDSGNQRLLHKKSPTS